MVTDDAFRTGKIRSESGGNQKKEVFMRAASELRTLSRIFETMLGFRIPLSPLRFCAQISSDGLLISHALSPKGERAHEMRRGIDVYPFQL